MSTPLLQTKLYVPPPRPGLVPRPRLLERLSAGLRRKLTLISAPAGFGKTTLISEWVAVGARGGAPKVAWLSLDEGDNDLTRFLTYLVSALQAAAPQTGEAKVGKGVLAALRSPQAPPVEVVLTALVNELAAHTASARIVLVLDDYHLVEAQPVHDALAFLLRHLPQHAVGGLHLVIVTREDPLLPLARLRARGQLTELRAADLRFTASETAEFLNQVMGLGLSTQDVAALETRTEGWIAGLQLSALALQGTLAQQGTLDTTGFVRSFTGSHRFVLDYLVEEVLEQQPQSVQAFLLQTCFLDRLTGSLCDAVRFGAAGGSGATKSPGLHDGQAILERLERANLFIVPLDGERCWYRYHRLFADLLCQRSRSSQPEQLPVLHQRASEWCERSGFTDEAIGYALRGEHFERAAGLIESSVGATWQGGEHTKLQRWLAELPGRYGRRKQ